MLLDIDKINRDAPAAKDTDGNVLTYGRIIDLSHEIEHLVRPRSLFFILTRNNVGGIAWVISTILSGNVPLILSANTEKRLLDNLISVYEPAYICVPEDWHKEDKEVIGSTLGYNLTATGNSPAKLYNELSHLLPTSGSTGSPKLVRHKYENIEAAGLNISSFFELKSTDRPLMVLPLHYTMGLSMVFSHLKVGATILITDKSMTDPLFWKFIKEEEATSFTGVPFSYEILDKMRFTRMKLPHLTLLTQGGGKMPLNLNLKFAEYCRDTGKRWIATYGQSEGTARMAWLPPEYAISKIGSIGIAVPNGRLSLRDTEGKFITTAEGTGEMCYTGRNVTMGYATCREELALGDERNGFLPTGDIAYRDSDGFYYIKGRLGRFLKIFGLRIGLDECEQIVKSHIDCECACTGNDSLLIVYLTSGSDAEKIRTILADSTHLPANVIDIRIINSMPKNEAGKILYSQLPNE